RSAEGRAPGPVRGRDDRARASARRGVRRPARGRLERGHGGPVRARRRRTLRAPRAGGVGPRLGERDRGALRFETRRPGHPVGDGTLGRRGSREVAVARKPLPIGGSMIVTTNDRVADAAAKTDGSGRVLLRLEDVKKVFYTDEVETHALSGVHMEIQRGEYVSISGPSGCGKSTLLSILGLLDTATDGQYWLDGKPGQSPGCTEPARVRNTEIGFML